MHMTNYLNRIIQELVEANLENYWPGFSATRVPKIINLFYKEFDLPH
ncbi:hypothetical protein JFL43_19990 [Viridibacillus sp. YIM B01967]|uniref:Uncharacterized protein n=1 Tax=Viridibacillus soli TaxID=2798301 RepID=A0ABS1HCM2_9BACL|nr:hypothetical protein [Viridibacillus soli]MBK3497076.1 hypothetical protein [Viridibacillus soli]